MVIQMCISFLHLRQTGDLQDLGLSGFSSNAVRAGNYCSERRKEPAWGNLLI